jgi:hypothetical protein
MRTCCSLNMQTLCWSFFAVDLCASLTSSSFSGNGMYHNSLALSSRSGTVRYSYIDLRTNILKDGRSPEQDHLVDSRPCHNSGWLSCHKLHLLYFLLLSSFSHHHRRRQKPRELEVLAGYVVFDIMFVDGTQNEVFQGFFAAPLAATYWVSKNREVPLCLHPQV